ncbi:MAG: YfhO family protein [Ignavibacteriales bacterium]|nr:YfhO family protein [Ignavibacteriales bacterium]
MTIDKYIKRETLFAVTLICLLVITAFWQLATMRGFIITDDIFTSDIMNEGFPYRYSMSESIKAGHLPLWVPEIYSGFPLLARAEAGIAYPINLILFGLLSPWIALNLVLLLTIITAGISTYLYAKEIGSSFTGAVVAGIAFGFSGYLLSHLKHLSNVNAACWLPLGLYLIERAIKSKDNRMLLFFGIIFGFQHLSGHTQVAYYSGVLYIFYFIFRSLSVVDSGKNILSVFQKWKQLTLGKQSWLFAGMLALGSLLAAIQLIPTYELVFLSQRSGGVTFEYASNYAFDPKNLGMFIYPYINGDIGEGTYTGKSIFWEDFGYVGIVTLLFALHAIFRNWKKWHVKFFTIAGLISIILVLGPNSPVYEFVFNYVPGMKFFRFPTRFLLITDLSLVVLASIGIPHFVKYYFIKNKSAKANVSQNIIHHPVEVLIILLCVADLFYFQLRQNPIVNADKWLTVPKSVEYLKRDTSLYRYFSVGANQAHIKTFQDAKGWEGDLQPFIDQREYIQPSSNVLYGISAANGYANLTPNYVVDIWGDQNRAGILNKTASIDGDVFRPSPVFWRLMDMYNVKYISSLWQIETNSNVEDIGKFGDAFFYKNNGSMSRAYLVSKTTTVRSEEHALQLIASIQFNPRKEVILFDNPVGFIPTESVSGTVDIKLYSPNEIIMKVSSLQDAFLVFSDSYYPGWKAYIDETESKIYRANVTQRSIAVPKGNHIVKFIFEPRTVQVGFWISTSSIIIFGFLFFQFNRKRKNEKNA